MRILTVGNMYPPHHLGGYERMWQASVEDLRRRGHEVVVLTTTHREAGVPPGPEPHVHRTLEWYWEDHVFRTLGPLETLRLERHDGAVFDEAARGADLVMWWSMGGMPLSLIARARRRGLRSLALVHDAWPVYGPKYDRWTARYARRLPGPWRYHPRQVDHWSFNSEHSRTLLGRAGIRLDPARTSVEHPGVDLAVFAAKDPKPWRWRLAYVGRVEPRKGVATAIRALARLPAVTRLTIAGASEPAHEAQLRALADELGVGGQVRWLGPVDDPAKVYGKADAVLFPVEWAEPFGLVPLEAMAVGRPVLATGTGGSGELLRDGRNALLVAPGQEDAWASAVMRLAQDPGLREHLRRGGHATAAAHGLDGFCAALARRAENLVAS